MCLSCVPIVFSVCLVMWCECVPIVSCLCVVLVSCLCPDCVLSVLGLCYMCLAVNASTMEDSRGGGNRHQVTLDCTKPPCQDRPQKVRIDAGRAHMLWPRDKNRKKQGGPKILLHVPSVYTPFQEQDEYRGQTLVHPRSHVTKRFPTF